MNKSKINVDELEEIGSIGVDAGCIWVGDPCYVMGRDAHFGVEEWKDYCNILDKAGHWSSGDSVIEPLGSGIGLHIQTYWGDGSYPVYAEMGEGGKVKRVVIDFLAD